MTEFERKIMEKQVLFEEGLESIVRELEGYAIFDNYIGHVSNEKAASMMYALDTSDSAELIDALVSICIKAMQKASPTTLEVMGKVFRLENEIDRLKIENKRILEELELKDAVLTELQTNNVQRTLVKHGEKIAYKDEVRPGEVLNHLMDGLPVSKIAEHFGVSRNLIYRRIKELKEAGIDVDTLKKAK